MAHDPSENFKFKGEDNCTIGLSTFGHINAVIVFGTTEQETSMRAAEILQALNKEES